MTLALVVLVSVMEAVQAPVLTRSLSCSLPHAACTISKHGKGLFCIVSRTIVVTHIVDIFCVSIDLLHPFQGFIVQLHHVRLKAFPVAGLLDCFQFFVPTSGMGPYLETCLDYNPGPKWSSKAVAQSVKLRKNTCWLLWHTLFLDSLDQQLNLECFWKGLAIKHTAYCLQLRSKGKNMPKFQVSAQSRV